MGKATSAPLDSCAKKTCDLGRTLSLKPKSSKNCRSWPNVILGLDISGTPSTKLFVGIVLDSGDCPDRPLVKPVLDRDMNLDRFPIAKHICRSNVRDMRLSVNPVCIILLPIVNDQDDRVRFFQPKFKVSARNGPGESLTASEPTCRTMRSLRASSRNAAKLASLSSGTMEANSRYRLTSRMFVSFPG